MMILMVSKIDDLNGLALAALIKILKTCLAWKELKILIVSCILYTANIQARRIGALYIQTIH